MNRVLSVVPSMTDKIIELSRVMVTTPSMGKWRIGDGNGKCPTGGQGR